MPRGNACDAALCDGFWLHLPKARGFAVAARFAVHSDVGVRKMQLPWAAAYGLKFIAAIEH